MLVTSYVLLSRQQRGPRSALRLAKRLEERGLQEKQPSLRVLRGGMAEFARMFAGDADLVEDYDPSAW